MFLEVSDFNQEAWREQPTGQYTLRVPFLPGGIVNTNPSINPILGFEDPAAWSASTGSLARADSPVTEGAAALEVTGIGYTVLTSHPLASQDLTPGSRLAYDLLLPAQQPGSWHGQSQVLLSCPSRNLYNAYVGAVELTGLPLEVYHTLQMAIPSWIVDRLENGPFSDLRIHVVLNAPYGSGRHLLDNFRFLP